MSTILTDEQIMDWAYTMRECFNRYMSADDLIYWIRKDFPREELERIRTVILCMDGLNAKKTP